MTVVNEDGRGGAQANRGRGPCQMRVIIEGWLPYPDYLRLMAQHRIVLQLDRSAVPGQVAGDCPAVRNSVRGRGRGDREDCVPEFLRDWTNCRRVAGGRRGIAEG